MSDLEESLQKLKAYVSVEKLIKSGDKILLALSGGADSTAMLVLLSKLRSPLNLTLLAVHINHQLRGEEANADEEFCRELCLRKNVPLIIRKLEFTNRRDLENQARIQRFHMMNQILNMYKFNVIATAHHKNDQAETIVMNMIRGAGINGLAGIKPISANVIHPMLCFEKQELLAVLKHEKLKWCEDSSNASSIHRRNVVRAELIPLIEAKLNPSFTEKICKQAEIFRKSESFLAEQSIKKMKKVLIDQDSDSYILSIQELMKLSDIERYYIFRHIYAKLANTESDFFNHSFAELMALCVADGSKWSSLQHEVFVKKQYDELSFSRNKIYPGQHVSDALVVEEDRAFVVHMDYRFALKHLKVMPKDPYVFGSPNSIVVDLDKLTLPVKIRSRLAGDKFMPLGLGAFKKLKDFFIDEKVPKFERDKVPILEDNEKIFWVVGHRMDERVKCDEKTVHFLHISAECVNTGRKRSANRKKSSGGNDEYYEL